MKRFIVALTLVLSVILPGFSMAPIPSVAPVSVEAHASDCPIYAAPITVYSAGFLGTYATINCHAARYKLTVYICGGINGNGYCAFGVTDQCPANLLSCSNLGPSTTCSNYYQGAYWQYSGAKLISMSNTGIWSAPVWKFGPGKWVQGGC